MYSRESCFDATCLFNLCISPPISLIKPLSKARKLAGNTLMSVDMAIKVLDQSLGKIVLIKLKGSKVIRGSLQGFDQHMNLSLESAEEIAEDGDSTTLGTVVVTGRQHHHDLSRLPAERRNSDPFPQQKR